MSVTLLAQADIVVDTFVALTHATANTFASAHGTTSRRPICYPLDASDFARCRVMFESSSERENSSKASLAKASPEWAAIVDAWEPLCVSLDRETPEWRTQCGEAPQTTALLGRVIRSALLEGASQ